MKLLQSLLVLPLLTTAALAENARVLVTDSRPPARQIVSWREIIQSIDDIGTQPTNPEVIAAMRSLTPRGGPPAVLMQMTSLSDGSGALDLSAVCGDLDEARRAGRSFCQVDRSGGGRKLASVEFGSAKAPIGDYVVILCEPNDLGVEYEIMVFGCSE